VILVDDVLNSGKTLMYAAKYFLTTPLARLSTVVLVDRTHNRFPIKADYVGLSLATTLQEYVNVDLTKGEEGVYLS
jgi:pyrimidine operon attenuation protein/uracil phosphoribosyltransferase